MFEIERKFLIKFNSWKNDIDEVFHIKQGYIVQEDKKVLRVRKSNTKYTMTFKMPYMSLQGYTYIELERDITKEEFDVLFKECKYKLSKIRNIVYHENRKWEIDEFLDKMLPDDSSYMCEIELNSEDDEISLPPWVGEEVTSDPRYKNINIARTEL